MNNTNKQGLEGLYFNNNLQQIGRDSGVKALGFHQMSGIKEGYICK